jgi:glycosyltransferase involved in cell wall biosynthesis
MYPGEADPDLGVFVAAIARELERRGHEVDRAVVDRRGGSRLRHGRLLGAALLTALRRRPDVVYAHFLVPAGAAAALAATLARAPLVVTAHGADVRNIGRVPGVRALTRLATGRAAAVVAVSSYLARELSRRLPELAGRVEVINSGVDLGRFAARDSGSARRRLGWDGPGPAFLFVGHLDERKNVVRLVEAFERLGAGRLALVGEGPLRPRLEGRPGVRVVGRVPHEEVAEWMAAADVVCLPSLVEPFGQVLLEAMASERSVVATRVGGPPEFVPPEAGVLVDPASVESIEAGLRRAAELPRPNPAARAAAAGHDLRLQAGRVEALLEAAADGREGGTHRSPPA